jgi:hypothetical protein
MGQSMNKRLASLFVVTFLLLVQMPLIHAQTAPSAKDGALAFINDVIHPDMSKYNISLVNDIVGKEPIFPFATQESIDYHLDANGNGPDIYCIFTNNVLTSAQAGISPTYAHNPVSTLFTTLSSNVTDLALATLEGYQTYTGENLQDMINILKNVDVTQNLIKISGDIKLTINNTIDTQLYTDISLKYTFNGTDYSGIQFSFKNGQFYTFMDDRSLWVIGNTAVNINESQAVSIAQQYIKNYSYTLDDGTVVKGFNVTSIQASQNFYPRDNSSTTVYPYWSVQVDFGQSYPGNVYAVSIGIWADSGQVFLAQPLGVGGGSPSASPTTASTIPEFPSTTLLLPIVMMVFAGLLVYFKKSRGAKFGVHE